MTEMNPNMTLQRGDPFFDVASDSASTSSGAVELPILYRDTSCLLAYFFCDETRVRDALGDVPFEPGLTVGRRALVGLAFFEYRDTSVGSYNEAGIAVPVIPQGIRRRGWRDLLRHVDDPRRELGFYILHLPVTTAIANAAGREIWGYPKFVTEISFHMEEARLHAEVRDPDGETTIASLSGRMGPALPAPTLSLVLYSQKDDRWQRTSVNARGHSRAGPGGSVRLLIGDSMHPMAASLRRLGLQNARPALVTRCPDFQSRLNRGLAMPQPGGD